MIFVNDFVFFPPSSWLEAGADIIETNTYQASVHGFQEYLGLNEGNALKVGRCTYPQQYTCYRCLY